MASDFWQAIFAAFILILFLLAALSQPNKSPVHYYINIFLVFLMMLLIISSIAGIMAYSSSVQFHKHSTIAYGLISLCPLIYIIGVILFKLFGHRLFIWELCQQLCSEVFCCCKEREDDFRELLPERMVNMDEGASLLAGHLQY